MCLYGTKCEKTEKLAIKKKFPKAKIINPGSYEHNLEKMLGGMEYCFKLVDSCEVLIFSRLLGKITAGVGKEINYALAKGKKVFELSDGKLLKISSPVKYISRFSSVALYEKWKMENFPI
jgi:hypothetical protein